MSQGAAYNPATGTYQRYTSADQYDEQGNPIYNPGPDGYTFYSDDPGVPYAANEEEMSGPPPLDFSEDSPEDFGVTPDDFGPDLPSTSGNNGGSSGKPASGGDDWTFEDDTDFSDWEDEFGDDPGKKPPPKSSGGGGGGSPYTPPQGFWDFSSPSYGGEQTSTSEAVWGASYGGIGQDPYLKALQEFSQPMKKFFNQISFNNF